MSEMANPKDFAEARTARTTAESGVTTAFKHTCHALKLKMHGRLPDFKLALDNAMVKFMDANLWFKHYVDLEKKKSEDLVFNLLSYEDYIADVEETY